MVEATPIVGRCGTCNHWVPCPEVTDQRNGYCALLEWEPGAPGVEPEALVELDAISYARVYTAPMFGCVLWEVIPAVGEGA
jgi:hypothetical protein